MLLEVVLGQRERYEDWLEMGRDLVRRGLRSPILVVTDGTPGLIRAMDELWAGQRPAAVYGALRGGPYYADVPWPVNSVGRVDLGIILAF